MAQTNVAAWLLQQGGPILRLRVAADLLSFPEEELAPLRQEALSTPEVQRWLDLLSASRNIHGSRDTDAENALGKLLDYGLDPRQPPFAQALEPVLHREPKAWDALILSPFLLRAGFSDHPLVNDWLTIRLETLHRTAQKGSYDFYLPPGEAAAVPRAWRGKPIYRDEFGHLSGYALPTCYDFYAMAHAPASLVGPEMHTRFESIVKFLSHPRFQSTPGCYGWDKPHHRCYAAGRVFLACVQPARLVLFLQLGAGFQAACKSRWFRQGLALLESHRTESGTCLFPPSLLPERTGTHLYGGAHMGLGENRRGRLGLELESTFHMLYIYKRMERAGT